MQPVAVTKWALLQASAHKKSTKFWQFASFHPLTPVLSATIHLWLQSNSYPSTSTKTPGSNSSHLNQKRYFKKEKLLFFFLRHSITFAEKCPEVHLSFRSYIRYKNIDASMEHTIRDWSMLSGETDKTARTQPKKTLLCN